MIFFHYFTLFMIKHDIIELKESSQDTDHNLILHYFSYSLIKLLNINMYWQIVSMDYLNFYGIEPI
jgi:hypothetical protein